MSQSTGIPIQHLPARAGVTSTASARTRSEQRLESVQILRAIAAAFVVLGHLQGIVAAHPAEFGPFHALPISGGVGVDFFFAISGFIIVHSGTRMLGRPNASRDFLTRRLARIVPLYWAATGAAMLLSYLGHHGLPPLWQMIASLCFVPYASEPSGAFYPIYDLGWTLNYEMQFYVLFAICMGAGRRNCVPATLALLGTLIILGVSAPVSGALAFWTRPILLEFCGGMAIAVLYQHTRLPIPGWIRAGLLVAAVALYAADPFGLAAFDTTPNDLTRVLGWGVPGALTLMAAVWTPLTNQSASLRIGVLLGNASFALYLLHPFAITFCRHVLALFTLPHGWAGWALIALALPFSAALSVLTYLHAEKPLTAWLANRLTSGNKPAATAGRADLRSSIGS